MRERAGRLSGRLRRPGVVITIALALACAEPATGPGPPRGGVLADTGGAIRLALMVVTNPARSALRNQELVETLTRRLGPRTHVLILADPEMVVEPNPWPRRMTFVPIPPELHFSIWPQDPFVVVRDPLSGTHLLAARGYGRAADAEMAGVVAAHLGWPVVQSELFFAGGNVLSNLRHAFVGLDLIRENASELGLAEREVVRRFEGELGLSVIPVAQAVEHIDMVLTPLDGSRVVLADAGAGAGLAERALAEHPETVLTFEEEAERNFFGNPALTSVTDRQGRVVQPPPVVGEISRAITDSRQTGRVLDEIALDLARRGYQVLRVPFLATRQTDPTFASYPMLSYNNVLVERVDGRDRVYVPVYGLAALDDAARRAWETIGFEVHAIPGVTTSAMYRGSVRCSVKVLDRG